MTGIMYLQAFHNDSLQKVVDYTVRTQKETVADRYLPNDNTYSTEVVFDLVKKVPLIASMIGYGAEPPVVDRDAIAQIRAELPKLGIKHIITESELLALANTQGHKGLVEGITSDGKRLTEAILNLVYVMKMQALSMGKYTTRVGGVSAEVDFQIPEENKITLEKASDWATDPNRDVLNDIAEWVERYNDLTFTYPEEILVSRKIADLLCKHPSVVGQSEKKGVSRISLKKLNEVFADLQLPPLTVIENTKITVHNSYTGKEDEITVFPENRLVLVSKGIGNFLFGPTVEGEGKPGIVLRAYDKQEPIQSVLKAVATGFPVLEGVNKLMHVDVM
ncbi:major capsid protein [Bacillus sp. JJ1127]|uniref:major capsid protein n=1 Tax=Bacillus sp. JJ1127 TaxID=3122952 RepID=UPI002FFE05C7